VRPLRYVLGRPYLRTYNASTIFRRRSRRDNTHFHEVPHRATRTARTTPQRRKRECKSAFLHSHSLKTPFDIQSYHSTQHSYPSHSPHLVAVPVPPSKFAGVVMKNKPVAATAIPQSRQVLRSIAAAAPHPAPPSKRTTRSSAATNHVITGTKEEQKATLHADAMAVDPPESLVPPPRVNGHCIFGRCYLADFGCPGQPRGSRAG
jgi:hypothetical protein